MISPTTRRLAITATVTVALLLTGCSTTPAEPDAPASTAAGFGHVHGIVDAGDGTVLLGTHTGLYTLGEDGTVTGPVGGIDLDAMGLTATGDTLYASGHPGPSTPAELGAPNLGIIRSLDAGASWEPVAFTGEEDFHVLTVTGDGTLYGIGSSRPLLRTSSDGGQSWADGAELPAVDLAAATDGTLYAATQDGLQHSTDGGATFTPAPDAPVLYLVETDPTGGVVGVDTDGTLRRLVGTGWENVGTTTGTVQALGVTGDGAIVLVDDRGVVWIRDTTATVLIPAATP
ncbi:hypothetical protein E5344_03175 [Microbacterium laevaniformans]|jgi:hypothetical protein|uniref:Exo-alpha-sialidase n=1 Tax=Microbacterium laevaniformans TaxID=36807 RepID=A0A4S2DFL9_9MICO|nr:hypothetical protein [Microbacterium laevaniformans]TGY39613.1 hypothetical protein E5344_03175 [Microbacterium laevaniformans]|tara:strand:- start:1930 stop:2790 length:861 start_codon:yes stop_codon:yes gene_type:complete